MANTVEAACMLAQDWLAGEEPYQFKKAEDGIGDDIAARLRYLTDAELETKWNHAQLFRMAELTDKANQLLMKTCGAARAVVVYQTMLGGVAFNAAKQQSWDVLSPPICEQEVVAVAPLLARPFEVAFDVGGYDDSDPTARGKLMFRRAVGLAVANLCEMADRVGDAYLPAPGVTSGELNTWRSIEYY